MSTKKRTGYTVLSALGFVVLMATLAFAQPDHMGGDRMGGGFAGSPGMGGGFSGAPSMGGGPGGNDQMGGLVRLLSALDLTDAQRLDIGSIVEDARDDMLAVRESVVQDSNPREELMALFVREDISLAEVKDVFDDIDRIQEEIRDIMLEAFVDIHDVLTSDQLAELGRLLDEHSGVHHGPGMPQFH